MRSLKIRLHRIMCLTLTSISPSIFYKKLVSDLVTIK